MCKKNINLDLIKNISCSSCSPLKLGDIITIAGMGINARGQLVNNGINIKTGRKSKAVKIAMFKVTKLTLKKEVCMPSEITP